MTRLTWIVPLAALAACAHRSASPPAAAAPEPAPAAAPPVAPAPAPEIAAAPRACATDAECGAGWFCEDARCVEVVPGLAACHATVHFAFDSASLAREELPQLERVARCAVRGASARVVVEGNADERGTVEYNVALGDRRAAAVASYLEHLGVPRAQLEAVSYGKEKPLCTEHSEACWSQNRRAAAGPAEGDSGR